MAIDRNVVTVIFDTIVAFDTIFGLKISRGGQGCITAPYGEKLKGF
jgi:hypothetical protein